MRSVSNDERTRADDNSDEKEHSEIPCHRRSLSDTVIISISFVNVVITSLFPFGMTTRQDEKIIEENVRSFPPVASASVIHPLFLLAELNRRTD